MPEEEKMTGVYTSQSLEIAESAKWAIALYRGEDGAKCEWFAPPLK